MTSLNAIVLASNQPMLALLRTLPVPTTSVRDAETIMVTLDLTRLELPAERSRIAAAHITEAAETRANLNRS